MAEEGDGSLQSEDEEQLRVEYDSDEFADDEGMSNLDDEDSSSQEYLNDETPPFLPDEFRTSSRHKKYTTGEKQIWIWRGTGECVQGWLRNIFLSCLYRTGNQEWSQRFASVLFADYPFPNYCRLMQTLKTIFQFQETLPSFMRTL